MNWPPSSTSRKRASSSGISGSYWEWTSTSGIVTAPHCSGLPQPKDEIRRKRDNACNDRVLGVLEAVVEALIARAEPVARAGDREGPDGRAGHGVKRVGRKRHLEDARGNRDERSDDRRDAPDEHAEVPPTPKPPLGAIEALGRHMQPTAAALEQRAP